MGDKKNRIGKAISVIVKTQNMLKIYLARDKNFGLAFIC